MAITITENTATDMATAANSASPGRPPAWARRRKRARGQALPGICECSLRGRCRGLLFLLAILLPGIWIVVLVARMGLAAAWGESLRLPTLRRAVALDGSNPELHFKLGTAYFWAEGGNPPAAAGELLEATRLNPNVAEYWSALGKACYAAGQERCSDQAFERATRLSPAKPRFAWEAALHYTVTSRPQAAGPHLRRLLRLQPERASQVFDLLLRTGTGPEPVWRQVAGAAGPEVSLSYLSFLVTHSRYVEAEKFWGELSSARSDLPVASASSYVEELLRRGHYRSAARVWARLQDAGAVGGSSAPSLLFNGGFERPPLEAGFDWHVQQQTYLTVDFADPGAHSGARALRLEFTVPDNSDYEPVYHFVSVTPGQTYALSAQVRSEDITSDSGPRLRVQDPQCPACLSLASAGTVGTQSWHAVELEFTAPAAAEVVRVSVWRPRSRSFPMAISGRAWVDDVSLRPLNAFPAGSAAGGGEQ